MTQRDPDSQDDIVQFANNAQHDLTFPKQEQDYDKLSEYLELNAGYLASMSTFDKAYQMYQEKCHTKTVRSKGPSLFLVGKGINANCKSNYYCGFASGISNVGSKLFI